MKMRRGRRPWPINLFAIVLFVIATFNLMMALGDLNARQELLQSMGFGFARYKDVTIIASSAWYTIELIPIMLVWLLASRFARAFITAMAALKALLMLGGLLMLFPLPGPTLGQALALAAVALLYTRDANAWFAKDEINPETFA